MQIVGTLELYILLIHVFSLFCFSNMLSLNQFANNLDEKLSIALKLNQSKRNVSRNNT